MNHLRFSLILSFLLLTLLSCEKEEKVTEREIATTPIQPIEVKVESNDTVEVNSTTKIVEAEEDEMGEDYYPFNSMFVIANKVNVRQQPTTDSEIVKSLSFGDSVWSTYIDDGTQFNKVYLQKPEVGQPEPPAYYMSASTLVDSYSFNEYKTNFSLKPFSELHSGAKRLILNNRYANNTNFELTQNQDRAKDVIAYGDYDSDGIMDVAILVDNVERQSSRLLVLCTNAATKEPYLAYANTYVDKLKVNSFKRGSKIFMEYDYLEPAPIDGIIIRGDRSKGVIIYDKENQKFKTYGQIREGM